MTDRKDIKIDKTDEPRTKDISKMIDEGGLGADNYYNVVKESDTEDEDKQSCETDDEK